MSDREPWCRAHACHAGRDAFRRSKATTRRSSSKQLTLLRKRLLSDPQSLRGVFMADGMQAIAWEFQQEELGAAFTSTLWNLLLRDDDMSTMLLRFVWNMPLKFKRKFVKAHRHAPVGPLPDVQGAVAKAGRARTTFRPTSARRSSARRTSSW